MVQLTFSAAMQGFFVILALWLQTGQRFSLLGAGVTTVAFSVGAFFTAPVAPSSPLASAATCSPPARC